MPAPAAPPYLGPGDNAGVALRGLFIIAPDGTLRQVGGRAVAAAARAQKAGRKISGSGSHWYRNHARLLRALTHPYYPRPAHCPPARATQITVNDLPVGRSVDETLRLLKAFQFTDVHGEARPRGLAALLLASVWQGLVGHVLDAAGAVRCLPPTSAGVPRQLAAGCRHDQAQPQGQPGVLLQAEVNGCSAAWLV